MLPVIRLKITSSLTASSGQTMNTKKRLISIDNIGLCDKRPVRIISEYITANESVSQNIEYKNGMCQNPDLIDKISQTEPIR